MCWASLPSPMPGRCTMAWPEDSHNIGILEAADIPGNSWTSLEHLDQSNFLSARRVRYGMARLCTNRCLQTSLQTGDGMACHESTVGTCTLAWPADAQHIGNLKPTVIIGTGWTIVGVRGQVHVPVVGGRTHDNGGINRRRRRHHHHHHNHHHHFCWCD